VKQREELGKDHINCATTLNKSGVCWMIIGEQYPTLAALEEASYIQRKHYGDGAIKVAKIITNI